ncbi:MAG TPA: hypothetical protein VEJ18_18075 [Planctomycetota bacterium]|nr:hypothetical protein [Planctomycetota bacterium]
MRNVWAAWILCLLTSCGGTVMFTGRDIQYERGFSVRARQADDRVLVVHEKASVGVALPYAEDWEFSSTSRLVWTASSRTLAAAASLRSSAARPNFQAEPHLQATLRNARAIAKEEELGLRLSDDRLARHGEHWVLEYVMASGETAQAHVWSTRQAADGTIYELHVSFRVPPDAASRDRQLEAARSIVGREFAVIPGR